MKVMKRIIPILLVIAAMSSCSIRRDHIDRKQNLQGYVEELAEVYYRRIEIDFLDLYLKGRSSVTTFTQEGEDLWSCFVNGVKVTITRNSTLTTYTYAINGSVIEDSFTTKLFTTGEGITNNQGILRVLVYENGIIRGWGEAYIDGPYGPYNAVSGEPPLPDGW